MSCTVKDIMEKLEELAPRQAACDWDNPGLLVGRSDREVERVFVALDASCDLTEEAIDAGADLILTHHPIIFHGIKAVNDDSALGIKLLDLIRNDVCVYSMHTNFDSCPGGMGDTVCQRLGLQKTGTLEKMPWEEDFGIGFLAELPEMKSAAELAALVKERFGLPFVGYFDAGRMIRRLAVCPGSGRGMLEAVISSGADAFLTGDMGHHEGLDYTENGISLLDAGHYGLEQLFIPRMAEFLEESFPALTVLREEIRFPESYV